MVCHLDHATSEVLPEPVFEGSEKRVEVDFVMGSGAPTSGLRSLPREQLDELMSLARCAIVSTRTNDNFDAYVLSESSLFVYPTKWVLKTCGTTHLLDSLPRLLELSAACGMMSTRCKYTRASFLFPENQPAPYSAGFEEEVAFLNQHFGHLQPEGGQAYVLGETYQGLQWHVYVTGRSVSPVPTYNVELCMTELDEEACQAFFRTEKFVSSVHTTEETGIINLLPGALIDDYVFEPCGYSMNGIDKHQFITIHVTPEKGISYASLEISGHMEDLVDCSALLKAASDIFKPHYISVAMSVDDSSVAGANTWGTLGKLPTEYAYQGANCCKLSCGGRVVYYTLAHSTSEKAADSPVSPKTVMHHSPSFLSNLGGITSSDTASEPACASEFCEVEHVEAIAPDAKVMVAV